MDRTATDQFTAGGLSTDQEKAAYFALKGITDLDTMVRVIQTAIRDVSTKLSRDQVEHLMLARGDAEQPRIEAQSGKSISTEQAADRFGVSAETIRKRVESGQLVGYVTPGGVRGRIRLPEWQFAGPVAVHPWVKKVIEAYDVNGWDLIDFLTTPMEGKVAGRTFSGESLLERLQAGDIDFVLEAARQSNPA